MPTYTVELIVLIKRGARDPEGETIAREMRRLGYEWVQGVRAGKAFIFTVEASSPEEAVELVREAARRLRFYNPVAQEAQVRLLAEGGGAEVPRH